MGLLLDTSVWLLVSFGIFCFILWKFGMASLLGMLDSRIADIRKEIQTAEDLRVEAQELLAQYQRKHKDALQEAEGIIKDAEKQAGEIRKKADQDLQDNVARREKQLMQRLALMEETAMTEIREHAASLAMEATTAIIAQNLDKKNGERLIADSIKALPKDIH